MIYPISSGIGEYKRIKKCKFQTQISNETKKNGDRKCIKPGEYVEWIYNKEVWYGIVEEYWEEFDDFRVNFLQHCVIIWKKYTLLFF